jgi:hypothetical protein
VNFSQYIVDLLFENDYVIVPGFGAFVASYKSSTIDDDQDTLYPPEKELSFNEKLKSNDTLLVNYVAEEKGISHFDALKEIEQFREDVQYKLEKGEKLELEGLGLFWQDEENIIRFKGKPGENLLLDSYGLGVTSLKNKENEVVNVIGPEPVVEEGRKRKGWLIFLILPIAAGCVFVYLNYFTQNSGQVLEKQIENVEPVKQGNEEPVLLADTVLVDSVKIESSLIDTFSQQQREKDVIVGKKYYLIGGSFKAQENAVKYFNNVKRLGFNPIQLGKQGNFYVVAIGLYKSIDEAEKAKTKFVDREPDSGVWIKVEH